MHYYTHFEKARCQENGSQSNRPLQKVRQEQYQISLWSISNMEITPQEDATCVEPMNTLLIHLCSGLFLSNGRPLDQHW